MKQFFPGLLIFSLVFSTVTGCKKEVDHDNQPPAAEAGTYQVITLPKDNLTLQGTGADADGSVVAFLWSQVSGPVAAIIVNPASPSTPVTQLSEGDYVFQLMVTDDKGATGVDTVSVKVNPSPVHTITLVPSNNPNEVNIVTNNGQDESGVGSPEIPLAAWTKYGAPYNIRQLLKFDMSSIPSNATIMDASLSLYSDRFPQNGNFIDANFGIDNSVLIQQVTSSWSPSSVGWYDQPSVSSANKIIIPTTTSSFLDLDINVTDMIASMISNNANYGFALRIQNEVIYTSRIFCSSFHPDATMHPKLVVTYRNN